jgi:hypothetical protein
MFKFDFTPSKEGAVDTSKSEEKAEVDRMMAKLTDRAKMSANSCILLDTSSVTSVIASEKLAPCVYERIDLQPSTIDGLHYVILPQHTSLSEKNTDIIPGVYEGGLKVWECSIDLCRFLAHIIMMDEKEFNDSDVINARDAVRRSIGDGGSALELGCGHGLPACLLLRESVLRCTHAVFLFSDFNDFVLRDVTIPNARLNIRGLFYQQVDDSVHDKTIQALSRRSVFAGGDWMGLSHKLSNNEVFLHATPDEERVVVKTQFDVILASETTYTNESCRDTAYLMLKHLKVDVGVGLVATKRFYFGVGGGVDAFTTAADNLSERCESNGLRLVVRTIQSYDKGNANIRDLLEVRLVKK